MAINVDKAHELSENGLAVSDSSGNILFYITSGSGDPTGSAAPVNTWYFRTDNRLIYYKFGAGDNDWRQIQAADIFALDQDSLPTTVQALLTEIASGGGTGVAQTMIFGNGGNKLCCPQPRGPVEHCRGPVWVDVGKNSLHFSRQ